MTTTELIGQIHQIVEEKRPAHESFLLVRLLHGDLMTDMTLDCPVRCLPLSAQTFNALMRGTEPDPPKTILDLVILVEKNELPHIEGLGPQRIKEIEARLKEKGFICDHG